MAPETTAVESRHAARSGMDRRPAIALREVEHILGEQ
jgi:hypothetical protein